MPNFIRSVTPDAFRCRIRESSVRPVPSKALVLAAVMSLIATAVPLAAQDVRILTRPGVERRIVIDDDRPMIGVSTNSTSERADTLGLRIESVQKDSPAEKAGLKTGDRLQSINGVSLRADRADAGERDYDGVLNRRLQRAVQATKAGESVEIRVLTGTQARTVRVATVKSSELMKSEMESLRDRMGDMAWTTRSDDRAVLGLTVANTGSKRDTLGVFVQSVVPDGPAEKAGIIEGDRIAAINGVSLRVAGADAEDESVGAAKADRLAREVGKLKVGETAELTVVTAGRTRTVRVVASKASELPREGENTFFFRTPDMDRMRLELRGQLEGAMTELRETPRRRVVRTIL